MQRRRLLLGSTAAIVLSSRAIARAAGALRHIGVLSPGPELSAENLRAIWAPLRDLGWIEGGNLVVDRRWANGNLALLAPLARELVRMNVEIIATIGNDATRAARDATSRIPIVMLSANDPVENGLVASLAHPGGNVTGYATVAADVAAKRVALLHELAPSARRIGVLVNPMVSPFGFPRDAIARACAAFGAEATFVEATSRASLASALEELARRRIDALVVVADGLFIDNRETVFVAAARNRWPVAAEGRDMLEAGALIAYEALMVDQLERMATFIDRILRGARPADLPVEQPTRFRLIVNLRAADALGVSVPQALQLRADEVMR
jgi:ABC-type uncharacterized transport system substrate-binding protein